MNLLLGLLWALVPLAMVLAPLAVLAMAVGIGAAIGRVASRRSRRDRIGEVPPAEASPRSAPADQTTRKKWHERKPQR